MKELDLGHLLPRFFGEHLIAQRNVSPRTLAAYRDAFRLLLRFLHPTGKGSAGKLPLTLIEPDNIGRFPHHLETQRHNQIRSRNQRLAAIRSFVRFAADLLGPDLPEPTRRVLAVPFKRHERPLLGYLTHEEIQAILDATDHSWTGRRDHLLFLLLYNTGARVSELISLRVRDAQTGELRQLTLHGKGRKERSIPLWPVTQRHLRSWLRDQQAPPDAPLLPNRFGHPISRSGVAAQLRKRVVQAIPKQLSLKRKTISPHIFRHSTAMRLLQSGVAPEVIALWLGHESPNTTHGYVEADLKMKEQTLAELRPPKGRRSPSRSVDALIKFLDDL